jgi:nucleoside-diphosphate-sugar epimerase|tara:strand:- start:94165 stop:95100 length:936 start_codon:yes stop_codon:yes gene_type:complete
MSDSAPKTSEGGRLFVVGCGYIGSAVVAGAVEKGWRVTALTRNADKAARLKATYRIEVIVADLDSSEWHDRISADGVSVVNCVSSGGGGVEGYRKSYYEGMTSLLDWAKKGAVRCLVYTSSTSVYPDSDGGWLNEQGPTAPSTPMNEVLVETEDLIAEAVGSGDLSSGAVMRLAGIYGPGRHYLLDMLREGVDKIPGVGDYYLNLIHRDDAARAILRALEKRKRGYTVWNLADGSPSLKEDIVAWAAKRLNVPMPVFSPELVTERMQRRLFANGRPPNRRIAAQKIRDELDWEPAHPSFASGYEAIIRAGF